MANEITVSGEQIQELVVQLQHAHRDLSDILANLQSELNSLSSQWTGAAEDAYRERQLRWNNSLQVLNAEIDRLRRRTDESNSTFAAAERANERIWGAR